MWIISSERQANHGITITCYIETCERFFIYNAFVAARLLESMDTAVDPCDDFFEYSCGSWNRLNDIPDDRSSYNTFAKLRDIIHVQLKGETSGALDEMGGGVKGII